jgi:uncharacterized repeat protein (TIGR02543 family)
MSSVLSLTKAGRLTPSLFQPSARNLYQLSYPRNSRIVTNLINYYQLMACTPTTSATLVHSASEPANLEYLINSMKESMYPVIISFEIYGDAGKTRPLGAHAVVGYDLTETPNDCRIKIWDPNSLSVPSNTLTIGKDFRTAVFANTYPYTFVRSAHTVEGNEYDYNNIQDRLFGAAGGGSSSGAPFFALRAAASGISDPAAAATTLNTNFASFTLTSSNGASATVTDGAKTAGELDIGRAEALNEVGAELRLRFEVPNLSAGETYALVPSSSLETYRASLFCDTDADGYYARVEAAQAGEYTFASNGNVAAAFAAPAPVTVASTTDGDGRLLYTASASGTGTLIGIGPDGGNTKVRADGNARIEVALSGDYNLVRFANVTPAGEGLTVRENAADRTVTLLDGDRNISAEKKIGYSISFRSLGGTPIAALTDIPEGETVPAPQNPALEGYTFGGWYTDPAYTSEWRFASPVTADMTLYALWTTPGGGEGSGASGGGSSSASGGGGGGGGGGGSSGAAPAQGGSASAPASASDDTITKAPATDTGLTATRT